MGSAPPPNAFPSSRTSGSTPSCSTANIFSGAPQAGLNLVGDHEGSVSGAELAHVAKVPLRRDAHTAFALHRLEDESGHILVGQCVGKRLDVSVRYESYVVQQRLEAAAEGRPRYQRERHQWCDREIRPDRKPA